MQSTYDSIYSPENIALFEALYGKNLISLGGLDAIDNMFSDINLQITTALDIGFGLGGVAFYLSKKYHIAIAGVEIHNWMAQYAESQAPQDIAHLLKFKVYDEAGEIPFKADSFDLAYSKGVLNHVRDKEKLFLQVNKVLRKDGLFVIADWLDTDTCPCDTGPLVKETQESYQQFLEKAGFTDIHFRDDSMIFVNYVKKLLDNISRNRDFIEEQFGKEIFSTIWNDHQKIIKDINNKDKFATRIRARKDSR